ncbi:Rho GTPase activating protein [Desmophyllum pertusum]|uniref:Rho GTPase activating protein n=1 Tax=Desmophyllum pertusum TaxID=174260 RepID=A0A9W9YAF8_9CNID|nr:Rho GTPase activating protein [Desmophyllum pertusum]
MALRIKGRSGHALDQLEYDIFWTEFRAIEESRIPVPDEDHDDEPSKEPPGECEQEVQWLKEAGFDGIVKKYKDSKEIDHNDVDFEKITGSLTRKQAEAVRKRIDTLNQSTKKKLGLHVPPTKHAASSYPTDVRTIFPVKTNGQPSNADQIHTTRPVLLRKSYSEGIHVIKPPSIENGGMVSEVGHTCRHSHSAGMLLSPTDKEFVGVHLHPDCAMERRSSDEIQLRTGIQQARHPHGGSVFYVTGTTKQELFNTAEKTKESSVDDVNSSCDLKTLSISPPDTSPDSFHEVPVDCPEEVPVDVPQDKIHGKPNGKIICDGKGFREPQFPRLPNFTLTKDELGVTRVQDISSQDMEKVRSLSLIELTALFDSHGLALHRRKPVKRRVRESGIFGVPLQNLLQEDKMRNEKTSIPSFYIELVRCLELKGLKEEGILRVPGNAGRVKAIREEVEDKYNDGCFVWDDRRAHDCSALLKQFLRELPFPLLTHEYQPTFASVESIPDRKQQLQALNLLILLLPAVHRDCLKILVQFLSRVVAHENKTRWA